MLKSTHPRLGQGLPKQTEATWVFRMDGVNTAVVNHLDHDRGVEEKPFKKSLS